MATRIKRHLMSKITPLVKQNHHKYLNPSNMKILPSSLSPYSVHLPIKDPVFLEETDLSGVDLSSDHIEDIKKLSSPRYQGLSFMLNRNYFLETILDDILKTKLKSHIKNKPSNIVIDFSSPNIAKPFHFGHLRSTIIGNFIANINEYYGENVTRINYLGDWGTQFGLLNVGVKELNYTDEQIRNDPINLLYKAYVHANTLAESDGSISVRAKEIFSHLEKGEKAELNQWGAYRKYTLDELINTYDRLGIQFDQYQWESSYGAEVAAGIVNDLVSKRLATVHEDGHKTITTRDREVTLQKKDGSSLYLTRDIAAVIDRYNKLAFDKMLYVVGNKQADHFAALFDILEQMDVPFKGKCEHVKFGDVVGLSTRKGNVVFLKDILDQARDKMYQQQKESINTKVNIDDEKITDILGVSAVIVNDLNQKRTKNYSFDWDKILKTTGISGIRLQYLHCRLCNLEVNSGIEIPNKCNSQHLRDETAEALIHHLASFDYHLESSRTIMDSYLFLNYLFKLATMTNHALGHLWVKNKEEEVAEQRLLLFHCARIALNRGMRILGLTPLSSM